MLVSSRGLDIRNATGTRTLPGLTLLSSYFSGAASRCERGAPPRSIPCSPPGSYRTGPPRRHGHRPLGYESSSDRVGNLLISQRVSGMTSHYWFLCGRPAYLSFEQTSGWYGSRTGADVSGFAKPLPFTAAREPTARRSAGGNDTRTRISVTTTLSPAVSNGSWPHDSSEPDAT